MTKPPQTSRLQLWLCLLMVAAAAVIIVLLTIPPRPAHPWLRITVFAATKAEAESLPHVRPSQLPLTILWQKVVALSPVDPVVVSHRTGRHVVAFEFAPVSGRSAGYQLRITESFDADVMPEVLSGSITTAPGTWQVSRRRGIPLHTMTPAETAGRGPDQTETVYGYESVNPTAWQRWFRWP